MIKKLFILVLILFVLTSCNNDTSTDVQNESNKNNIVEVSENGIATVLDDTFVYSTPNEEDNTTEVFGKNDTLEYIAVYKTENYNWYKIDNDKWIKSDSNLLIRKNAKLPEAANWEEMANIITNGYWLIRSEVSNDDYQIEIFKTLNLGLASDEENYCLSCSTKAKDHNNKKGIITTTAVEIPYSDFSRCYLIEHDDIQNKLVSFIPAFCTDFYETFLTIDYSKISSGILFFDCVDRMVENGKEYFYNETYYYFETFEEAEKTMLQFNKSIIGTANVITNGEKSYKIKENSKFKLPIEDGVYYVFDIVKESDETWYNISQHKNYVDSEFNRAWINDKEMLIEYTQNQDNQMNELPVNTKSIGKVIIKVDNLRIRSDKTTNADKVGVVGNGEIYNVYDIHQDNDYTWYRIGNNMRIADDG